MFFYEPIGRLHGLNQMLQSARAAAARVFDILDMTEERSDRRGTLQKPVRGEIVYENVSFSYAQEERRLPAGVQASTGSDNPLSELQPERRVLHNISLHAAPGEMIALVGPTGAGKSTLVNLLPAFYEATAGKILIDGQDIKGISLESLREHISVVSQEAFLFNGTVRENILYGRLNATEEELIRRLARRELPRFHQQTAERLRFPRRRTRREIERRRKTTREHRPRAAERCADSDSR